MSALGILAYGSLIDNPGWEIEEVLVQRVPGITTPFAIEFARSSGGRHGAPTLIPVDTGGNPVEATILVLQESIPVEGGKNLLWRRETCQIGSGREYLPPPTPTINTVLVDECANLGGVDVVLSTRIGANILGYSPTQLAELAIKSAKKPSGGKRRDGISYLISALENGISTPLSAAYAREILRLTGAESLKEAWKLCQ